MAITYGAKLFESTATTDPNTQTVGTAVLAGRLVVLALCGMRSGTSLNIASISDSQGNTWDWVFRPSTDRALGLAWSRLNVPLGTSDTITVDWNGTPSAVWYEAHSYSNADGTPIDEGYSVSSSDSSTASHTVAVSGSDFLVCCVVMTPYDYGLGAATALNSMTERDDNNATSVAPWCEYLDRNYTTGSTFQAGLSLGSALYWGAAAVSFPYLAVPASRGSNSLMGV